MIVEMRTYSIRIGAMRDFLELSGHEVELAASRAEDDVVVVLATGLAAVGTALVARPVVVVAGDRIRAAGAASTVPIPSEADKIDVGVGVYKDSAGNTPILRAVTALPGSPWRRSARKPSSIAVSPNSSPSSG